VTEENLPNDAVETPSEPARVPPMVSRFLFVDVAALRAKQLRRGALPRLAELKDPAAEPVPGTPRKAERIAMEEVRQGLVSYELPVPKLRPVGGGS
jgi:DNA-directed RNA polymerase subunit K/omega